MKKLIPLFLIAVFGLFMISCDRTETIENVTEADYPAVYDLNNVNLTYNSTNGIATFSRSFQNALYDSDYVMIYRKVGNTSNNAVVWQPLPQTIYNLIVGTEANHELDYTYDYSKFDFAIYASGTFDLSLRSDLISNQTFRVILVPAVFGKGVENNLSKMSYDEVIKKYNIDDSKVVTLN